MSGNDKTPERLTLASDFPPVDEAAWRALVDKALKGGDFEKELVSHALDGLRIEPLYTQKDAPDRPFPLAGFPKYPDEDTGARSWDVRTLITPSSPADANAAILEDLEGGATSITLRLAAPEQTGVRIYAQEDMDEALRGVHLDAAGVWLEAGVEFAAAAEQLQAVWAARKLAGDKVRGGFGADPLGSLARAGGLPYSLEQTLAAATALARYTHEHTAHVTALTADARPYHDGGASGAQELACLCATTVAYLRACESDGLAPEHALPRIEFALSADADLFATIARLRGARLLIARIAEAAGAESALGSVRLAATTSQRMMAKRDVHTNMLRATLACAGAALGGADAITVLPFTWPLGQPDRFARRMARNIQLVLREEAALARVADPAGGSWAVERLSHDLAARAWALFQDIEARGGMGPALATGAVQAMLARTAEARAREVATARDKLTGITAFPHLEEAPVEPEPWDWPEELDAAVTVEPVPLRRPAASYEALRDKADAYLAVHGARPQIFLAILGRPADCADRAAHAAGLFAAGGIHTINSGPLPGPEDAARAFKASGAKIACLCGSDAAYEQSAAATAQALKAAGAKRLYLVGRAGEAAPALKAAGIDGFLHEGVDMLEVLTDAQDVIGVR